MVVSGHPADAYNGTYAVVDERDGWPVLQNEHGVWFFRFGQRGFVNSDTWRLWHDVCPLSPPPLSLSLSL